jgi:hypothetical protein
LRHAPQGSATAAPRTEYPRGESNAESLAVSIFLHSFKFFPYEPENSSLIHRTFVSIQLGKAHRR